MPATPFRRRSIARLRSLLGWTGVLAILAATVAGSETAAPRWYKGNLHTHSLWSDGNDYPEMIADWYKERGYHFLAFTEHNTLHEGQRWIQVRPPVMGLSSGEQIPLGAGVVLERYVARFGRDWVEQRQREGKTEVRLKPLAEYRAVLEEPGRFLLIPGEEISSTWTPASPNGKSVGSVPLHINVTNIREALPGIEGASAVEVMQRTVDAVVAQRERTGQPMFPHINHPNFRWAITAEDLMQVKNERFFEVYNGHQLSFNDGDASHLSLDAMWDIVLTRRLAELHLPVMYALATDDAHNFVRWGVGKSNAGRGWVMVRAAHLTAEALVRALEAGDFYASTGVRLREVNASAAGVRVEIEPEAGVTYTVRFIGTRAGYDRRTAPLPAGPAGEARTRPHLRYSADVGATLAEVAGTTATYRWTGDELYVRAKIISSKPKENGGVEGEFEVAWTQPVVRPPP